MGTFHSKGDTIKRDKNHNRQKMFRFGISFGRNDLNLEGHLQMGYNSKTIKNYGPLDKQLVSKENVSSTLTGTEDRLIYLITPGSEAITTED
jgi:hypothetical protein